MNWILNIDTSLESATVFIAKNSEIICSSNNENQKDHASFLEPAIQSLIKEAGISLADLSAIAVVSGPGSYTGLRVALASAKALCYALGKPLILINNLELMTMAVLKQWGESVTGEKIVYCPMIDARRMEVYTAIYDAQINPLLPPCAVVLDQHSYENFLTNNLIYFFGNGAQKWKDLCSHKNARFIETPSRVIAMSQFSAQKLDQQDFSSISYAEPLYIKEFYTLQVPKNLA